MPVALVAAVWVSAVSAQDRQFRSAAEARAWLKSEGIGTAPASLLVYLSGDSPRSVDVMRAYVALKLPLDRPGGPDDLSPLTLITRSCVGNAVAAMTTAVLVEAGANPALPAPDGTQSTPLMEAVACPAILKSMLAGKTDLSVVDQRGYTVMHHALNSDEARGEVARLVLDAGFDLPRWRTALLKEFGSDTASRALLEGRSAGTTAPADTPVARAGADTTADDHFWDAISRRQPQRLAAALQAGVNVQQRQPGSNYTPLMTLAEGCDDKDVAAQLSMAEQLVAAKADTAALSLNKSNALTMGASRCPIAVVKVLIAAGVPVTGTDAVGNTALKLAILGDRADVVTALIDAGVDPRKEPYNTGRLAGSNKEVEAALKRRPRQ